MKIFKQYAISVISGILLLSFIVPPKGYVISGSITGKSTKKIYLIYELNNAKHIDSANIKYGKFTFRGRVAEPAFYTLALTKIDTDYNNTTFLLENRDVKIRLTKDTLNRAQITGLPNNEIYKNFYSRAWKPVQDSAAVIYGKLNKASQNGKIKVDSATQKKIDEEFLVLDRFNEAIVSKYVQDHISSVAAPFIVYDRFVAYPNMGLAAKLYNLFPNGIKKSAGGKMIKKALDVDAITGIGKTAPDIAQLDTASKLVNLHDFRGKYVLVDFWASWCGPCRAENPNVVKVYQKYHDKGFDILGVSLDSKKSAWLKAIQADGLTWSQVSDLKGWNNAAAGKYGVKAVPQNFLLDKEGKIIAKNLRGENLEKQLVAIFK